MTAAPAAGRGATAVVDRLASAVGAVGRRETHGSWVLLTDSRAFKIKKPVVMAFLDYGTLARRRAMCRAEVEVNRRAAPGTYLGVRAIVADGDGVALAPEDAEGALEYAVEMRRFDETQTLAAAVRAGTVDDRLAAAVGARIAAFHERCEPLEVDAGAEHVKRSLDDDFASLRSLLSADAGLAGELVAAERAAASLMRERWQELDARARTGRVRDGHGDLRAEHVLLDEAQSLVDAIEFNPALRGIDVGLDLAFLVMELQAEGRADLSRALVAGYRAAGGDPGDDRLLAFFAAYRARVRAKVALLRAAQVAPEPAAVERRRAERLLRLGTRLLWEARRPTVIALAGVAASGKSTLARALADRSGAALVGSDLVRKELLGLAPAERAPASAYGAGTHDATYRELARRAAEHPGTVILDATFHRRPLRDAFRATLGGARPLLFVECAAPVAVLERRIRARERDPDRISDATLDVLRRQLEQREPLDEVPAADHLVVRSDQAAEIVIRAIEDHLDGRTG